VQHARKWRKSRAPKANNKVRGNTRLLADDYSKDALQCRLFARPINRVGIQKTPPGAVQRYARITQMRTKKQYFVQRAIGMLHSRIALLERGGRRSDNAHGSCSVPQLLTLCKRQNSQVTVAESNLKTNGHSLDRYAMTMENCLRRLAISAVCLAKDEIEVGFFSCWIAGCPLSPSCYVNPLRLLGLMPGPLVSSVPTAPKGGSAHGWHTLKAQ